MAAQHIRGLAKMVTAMIVLCKIIDVFGGNIRNFVPDESKSSYDAALVAIKASCDAIRAIAYQDLSGGTNAPWGRE